MADETFDALWQLAGGKELAALHELMEGERVSLEEVRDALGLAREDFDAAVAAGGACGLLSVADTEAGLLAHPAGSPQRIRLDAFLDRHREEWTPLVARLNSLLLLRFLRRPPHPA